MECQRALGFKTTIAIFDILGFDASEMSTLELRELGIRRRGASDVGPIDLSVSGGAPLAMTCEDETVLDTIARALVDGAGISSGEVALDGTTGRHRIARFGLPLLKPSRHSVQRVLQGELKRGRIAKEEWDDHVQWALHLVGLERHREWRLCDLSESRLFRASLASNIVTKPDVVIIDQPTRTGAHLAEEELIQLIQDVARSLEVPVVIMCQSVREALSLGDEVALLAEGKLLQWGASTEVYRRPRNRASASMCGDANFLNGRVIRAGAGFVLTETEAGQIQAAVPEDMILEIGQQVTVMVRPEAVKLERMMADDNCISGEIERVIFSGPQARYWFKSESGILRIDEAHPRYLTPGGGPLYALIDPDDAVALAD